MCVRDRERKREKGKERDRHTDICERRAESMYMCVREREKSVRVRDR